MRKGTSLVDTSGKIQRIEDSNASTILKSRSYVKSEKQGAPPAIKE